MSAFVDNLNLRPQEKRLIVIIGIAGFALLNMILVWPHFKDKASIENQLKTTRKTILDYQSKIAEDTNPNNGYIKQLEELKQQGGGTGEFGGDIKLQTTVAAQARASGVSVQQYDPVKSLQIGTNQGSQFFEKQSMSISATSKEENLVNFLYNVGNDPAMIRVWELELHPGDANRYELKTRIVLTADYKKNSASKAVPAKADVPLKPTATMPHPAVQNAATAPGSAKSSGPPAFPAMPGSAMPPGPSSAPKSAAMGRNQ